MSSNFFAGDFLSSLDPGIPFDPNFQDVFGMNMNEEDFSNWLHTSDETPLDPMK